MLLREIIDVADDYILYYKATINRHVDQGWRSGNDKSNKEATTSTRRQPRQPDLHESRQTTSRQWRSNRKASPTTDRGQQRGNYDFPLRGFRWATKPAVAQHLRQQQSWLPARRAAPASPVPPQVHPGEPRKRCQPTLPAHCSTSRKPKPRQEDDKAATPKSPPQPTTTVRGRALNLVPSLRPGFHCWLRTSHSLPSVPLGGLLSQPPACTVQILYYILY